MILGSLDPACEILNFYPFPQQQTPGSPLKGLSRQPAGAPRWPHRHQGNRGALLALVLPSWMLASLGVFHTFLTISRGTSVLIHCLSALVRPGAQEVKPCLLSPVSGRFPGT